MPRIPTTVDRDDFLEALQPLLNLLHVDKNELADHLHYEHGRIVVSVVARRKGDNVEFPDGIVPEDPPQEAAELYHRVSVEVLG